MVEPVRPAALPRMVAAERRRFAARYGSEPAVAASAPGRINVIGEHTDYNSGLALPGAIDRWVVVTLSPRTDDLLRVHSEALGESLEGRLRHGVPAGWGALPTGAGRLFAAATGAERGFDALIGGNVPRGAGVSSSAAVEMALLNALRAAAGADIADLDLVRMAQRIEHDYLGVETGLMDQYTSQFARANALMLIDFDAVAHEHVALRLDGWVWLLLDTKVRHDLADSAYGDRVEEMRIALARVANADASVRGFRDLREAHVDLLDNARLRRRLRHYVRENDRVRSAVAAATGGDAAALGELMRASHGSLRDDYEVSCAELDLLVAAAGSVDGCAGARMMGGGFGGCTINLVRADAVDEVVAAGGAGFERRFGYAPEAAVYRLVGGALVHDDSEQI
jgi:galactokinase